ncbi:MAG: polysaccharide pyruvyl transferase family protein [Bacteroidales bacterium]|nr:polysaccharide pyruvyl transferase family protein [Bacteroidales bacterium]
MIYEIEKWYVKHTLEKSFLKSDGIINIHRLNTTNSGDLKCAPYLYFPELNKFAKLDILGYLGRDLRKTRRWTKSVLNRDIVLGGGGLLDRDSFFHSIDMMKLLLSKGRKIVPWGVGHNHPSLKVSKRFFKQINDFKLIGLRDYGIVGVEWVPCVSCMNDVFDKGFEQKLEVGIIRHETFDLEKADSMEVPILSNNAPFDEIISFIGGLETLITNSYHAMYWAMLMRRKVIVVPNSSKMSSFKYQPPLCNDIKDYKSYLKKSFVVEGLLEECRELNQNFSVKVFEYLNIV